jgi:hypothetical protein
MSLAVAVEIVLRDRQGLDRHALEFLAHADEFVQGRPAGVVEGVGSVARDDVKSALLANLA